MARDIGSTWEELQETATDKWMGTYARIWDAKKLSVKRFVKLIPSSIILLMYPENA